MASFNPNEWKKTREPEVVMKLPLRRFDPTLRKLTQVVVPTDLDRLRRHQMNMEKHLHGNAWQELNVEQINASRTVQQLRATVRDLENTRQQIQESDLDAFDQRTAKVKNDVIDAIASFKSLENEMLPKMREMASPATGSSLGVQNRGANHHIVPTSDGAPKDSDDAPKGKDNRSLEQLQIQIQTSNSDQNAVAVVASWNDLRQSLVDLNVVINEFSDIVAQQQEQVDTISENVERAHLNVRQGVVQLAQANKYKAAVLPVAGAVVGGLVGGPIGLIAGFKLAGVATALGGSFVGWQGAKYLKRRRDEHIQVELNKLSSDDESQETDKLKKA